MQKVALIDETGEPYGPDEISLSLIYLPDGKKSTLHFSEFYDDVTDVGTKLFASTIIFTKPAIGEGLEFPIETDDYFSADVRCLKDHVYNINPDGPFSQVLQELGYRTVVGYRHTDKITLEEIRDLLKEEPEDDLNQTSS